MVFVEEVRLDFKLLIPPAGLIESEDAAGIQLPPLSSGCLCVTALDFFANLFHFFFSQSSSSLFFLFIASLVPHFIVA